MTNQAQMHEIVRLFVYHSMQGCGTRKIQLGEVLNLSRV